MSESEHSSPVNFIYQIIRADQQQGKHDGRVVTRFPPEPNGYLHIGHAKSICLNFGAAATFGGLCNLRFDDTNPEKENVDFIESIRSSIRWLGFDWGEREYYASGYFEQLYDYAHELIDKGLAYVCSLSAEQAREYRGTLTSPGRNSPDRERSIEDSKDLFQRMRAGEFADGSYSLRAKIDMTSANMNMRDPVIYRIRHLHHHQTGDQWCIYPTYDFTHGLSDAIEGITHSLCSLEFEDHRPLYDWFLDNLDVPARPRQYEFARLNLNYTVMSKRKLLRLVERGDVAGWDDPRMPTLEGMRRRGYTAAAIRQFCEMIGVTRTNSVVDMAMLEHCLRDDLDKTSPRAMCVLRPLKVVLDSYPADQEETLTLPSHPKDESMGQRQITFRRELYIDRNDFAEEPPKGFKRLIPGGEVRLRGAYVIRCDAVVRDESGEVIELRCSHDPATLGNKPEGRKVKGVIHWVPVDAPTAEIRLYDRLFSLENPEAGGADYTDNINPDSLQILHGCRLEPGVESVSPEARFQFEREGFFCADREDHQPDSPVFNLTIGLRDTWGKG